MKRPGGKTLDELHSKWSADPDYATAYADLEEEFGVAEALTQARTQAGLTQAQLAAKIGSKQSAVSRLEAGAQDPKLSTLGDYASATGVEFHIMPTKGKRGFRIWFSKSGGVGPKVYSGRKVARSARRGSTTKARA